MLVRDLGDAFQIVLQPDNGEASGAIAAAWRPDPALSPELRRALVVVAARHDDGWAVWERHARLDADGRPQGFASVPLYSLLSSYQACVEVLAAEDRAAALLVSMHVSGLQRNRYGVMDPARGTSPLDGLEPRVRDFVNAEEERQAALTDALGFAEPERRRAYHLLQVYDLLSLYLGLADLEHGETRTILAPASLAEAPAGDGRTSLDLLPLAEPGTVRCAPFPFASDPVQIELAKRLLPKRDWPDESSFRRDFAAAPVQRLLTTFTA